MNFYDEPSLHERVDEIKQNDKDRKSEISNKIKFGDSLFKIFLIFALGGFWVFWLIVVLAGL